MSQAQVMLPDQAWEGVEPGVLALVDRWLVPEGTRVKAGQPLVRVVLVKSTMQVEAPVTGVLGQVLVRAGRNFARGQPLGLMEG